MVSKVYFTDMRTSSNKDSVPKKLRRLYNQAGFSSLFNTDELVAVKLHLGERGNLAFIHPALVRQVVEKIKENGGKPFLTDTNTLYTGSRANSVDHLETAVENGFSYATVNAPIIIADGLHGKNFVEVQIQQKHFDSVKIGSDIFNSPSMLVLSHFKGHIATGFGGALKNLGMGCSNRGGKQMMHSLLKPKLEQENCVSCGVCKKWCPAADAISFDENKKAVIDYDACVGCGECTASCLYGAIKIQWKSETSQLQERMVEFALGAVSSKSKGKIGFINFVMNVAPDCDCHSWNDAPIVPDVGIIASMDPVALDQASLDLVNRQTGLVGTKLNSNFSAGQDKFSGIRRDIDHTVQLSYAEEIGLGTRMYELIEINL